MYISVKYQPEDSELEVQTITPGLAKLVVIPSIWGHQGMAVSVENMDMTTSIYSLSLLGGCYSNDADAKFVSDEVQAFLEST